MSDDIVPHRRLKKQLSIGPANQPARIVKIATALVQKVAIDPPKDSWFIDDDDMDIYKPKALSPYITFQHKMSVGNAEVRIKKVGFCIYCGANYHNTVGNKPCTEEHIIPKGLGGNLILEEASCQSCADAVNTYEGNLLRNLFNAPRRSMSVRGRSKKYHPTTISTLRNGVETIIELPIDVHPSTLIMPSLYLPQLMSFNEETYQGVQKIWCHKINRKGFSSGSGLTNYMTPELDFLKFGQMLAKIAYSYSVGFSQISGFTLDRREPIINERICPLAFFARKKFNKSEYPLYFYDFVGGFSERFEPSNTLHQIGMGKIVSGGFIFDVVYVWLFANLGAPIYCIVIDCIGFTTP